MPRRSAEDKISQTGGVFHARAAPRPEPPASTWNPFQELETEEPELAPVRALYHAKENSDEIPDGLEGRYFF